MAVNVTIPEKYKKDFEKGIKNLASYIDDNCRMKREAIHMTGKLLISATQKLGSFAMSCAMARGQSHVSAREMEEAVHMMMHEEIRELAVKEGSMAVEMLENGVLQFQLKKQVKRTTKTETLVQITHKRKLSVTKTTRAVKKIAIEDESEKTKRARTKMLDKSPQKLKSSPKPKPSVSKEKINFDFQIEDLLLQLKDNNQNVDISVSSEAFNIIEACAESVYEQLANCGFALAKNNTLTPLEINNAVNIIFPETMIENAKIIGEERLKEYMAESLPETKMSLSSDDTISLHEIPIKNNEI